MGIYWNNHHHMLHAATRISAPVLWANHHLLFWLSLVPFATSWLGEDHSAALPSAIYAVIMLGSALAYTLLQASIIHSEGETSRIKRAIGRNWKGKASALIYCAAIPMAFLDPTVSQGFSIIVAIMWFLPDRRLEALINPHP